MRQEARGGKPAGRENDRPTGRPVGLKRTAGFYGGTGAFGTQPAFLSGLAEAVLIWSPR